MSKNVKIVILANTGTEENPEFKPIGGQRSASLSEANEMIDVTSEDSQGVDEFEYGNLNWTISCDGLYVPTAEGYQALKAACREKKKVLVRIQEGDQETEQGLALVTSRDLDGEYNGETTYSIELQGSGPIEAV